MSDEEKDNSFKKQLEELQELTREAVMPEYLKKLLEVAMGKGKASDEDKADGEIVWEYVKKVLDEREFKFMPLEDSTTLRAIFSITCDSGKLGRTTEIFSCFGVELLKRRVSLFFRMTPTLPIGNAIYSKLCTILQKHNNELFAGAWMLIDHEGELSLILRLGLSYSLSESHEIPGFGLVSTLFKIAMVTIYDSLPEIWKEIEEQIPADQLELKNSEETKKDYGLKNMEVQGNSKH